MQDIVYSSFRIIRCQITCNAK